MAQTFQLALYAMGGLLALGLGALLLTMNRRHAPNSALAAFLLVNGSALALAAVARELDPGSALNAVVFTQQALVLASVPLLLLFVALYPEDLRRGRWPRLLAWGSVLALVAMETAYFLDWRLLNNWGVPGLFGPQDFGPLWYVAIGIEALAFAAAFLLLRDGTRLPPGPRRNAVCLVSFGCVLYAPLTALGDNVSILLHPVVRARTWSLMQVSAETWALIVPRMLALVLFLALAGYAGFLAARSRDADARARAKWYVAGLGAVFLASMATTGVTLSLGIPMQTANSLLAVPALNLPSILIGYAFLRYQLFATDVRVRRTIRRGALAGALVSGTLGVVTVVQTLFPQVSETTVWVAMTGLAALLQGSLRRGAERLESWVVPAGPEPEAQEADEPPTAAGLYQGLASRFWSGERLSREDRRLLAYARKVTHLDPADALRIEEDAALDGARALVPLAGPDAPGARS